ncbi:MAG TPA: Ig-like domain-containing protein, partial [Lapillicoccus sp.]|nr:Ig-like domain-containing protein [Lapillicoccus sp.]
VRQAVFVHIAGGSEPASYTFTLSNAQSAAGGILAYTGVDPANPIDASGGQANVASTSITAPSITTTGTNRLLVGLFATAALTTETAPAGMTERYDQQVPSTNTYKVTTAADDQLLASAGATGTRVALAAASGINIGQLVALTPGGGGPPDNTPPQVTTKTPAANATSVGIATNVTATFEEDVVGVSGTTFTLEGPGNTAVPATVAYSAGTRTATLDPTGNLANNTVYTATLTSGITDTSSNALVQVQWTFTTAAADTTPPQVTTKTPAANATSVGIATNVTATFNEDVVGVSGTTFTLEAPGPVSITATVTYDAGTRTATLDPSANLANNTVYTATLTSGITDTSSNALVQVQWTFTTAAADNTPPQVTTKSPAANATNVAIGANVTATFDEDVLNVNGTTFTLEGPGNTAVTAVVTYDGPTKTATLNPSANLANGTLYTATLTSGITDTSSNALVQVQWTFTTVAADNTPPQVTTKSPAANATNVAIGANVTATFDEDVTGVSGTTFTLEGPGNTPVSAVVTYDNPTRTATLNPSGNLANGTVYTATLTSGITDTSSNALSGAPVTWSFTTAAAPPSGIAFRSASSANNVTATTLVIPAPAGVTSGDALLAVVSVRGAPAITPPAGWTLVRLDANASTMRQAVFVRIAGGSEPASYTFTLSNAQSAAGGIVAYTGVDATTPVDVHGGQLNASSTSITAPSITTTGANRMIVGFFGTPVLTSVTPPGGMTERFDQTVPSTNTYKVTSEAASQSVAGAGATGTRVATAVNAAANIGQLVALNPAP